MTETWEGAQRAKAAGLEVVMLLTPENRAWALERLAPLPESRRPWLAVMNPSSGLEPILESLLSFFRNNSGHHLLTLDNISAGLEQQGLQVLGLAGEA